MGFGAYGEGSQAQERGEDGGELDHVDNWWLVVVVVGWLA